MKRVVLGFTLVLMTMISACETSENELVVGLECNYAPFNWTVSSASDEAVEIDGVNAYCDGYDVVVAEQIANELGLDLVIRKIEWDGLIPALLSDEIDVIIAATILPKYTETETRQDREVPVIREPVFERHEHGDSVTITADLPGTAPEDIQYALFGEVLYLTARAEGIIYRATYLVGGAVADTLTHTFKHGVIEFTYQKQDIPPEKEV